jgi:hypothetical protein
MNAHTFFVFAILLAISPVVPFIAVRWFRRARSVVNALRVLARERRTGETLYDTAEAIAGDAHNWRGMTISHRQAEGRIDRNGQKSTIVTAPDGYVLTEDWNLAVVPQPPPKNTDGPALWPMIIAELGDSETERFVAVDMLQRHELGMAKYGVPLVANNGRDHLADAYQEALDEVVYLRAAFDPNAMDQRGVVRASKIHQLYVDSLDMAKELRELIHERDGR